VEASGGIDSLLGKLLDQQSRPKSNYYEEAFKNAIYYIGLDIHKKSIAYCIKESMGRLSARVT